MKDVLKILEDDARTSVSQIATMTGLSRERVARIIKEAEKEGIILKYKTVINWDKAQNEHVLALIGVKLTPQKDVGFDAVAGRISRYSQARTVYLVSGNFDLIVLVEGRTSHEIADFVSEKLAPIEGVQETVTQFLLKRYKEDGAIIVGQEEVRRQPVVL